MNKPIINLKTATPQLPVWYRLVVVLFLVLIFVPVTVTRAIFDMLKAGGQAIAIEAVTAYKIIRKCL